MKECESKPSEDGEWGKEGQRERRKGREREAMRARLRDKECEREQDLA